MNNPYNSFILKSHLLFFIILPIVLFHSVQSQTFLKNPNSFSFSTPTGYFAQIGGGISFPILEKDFKNTANLGFNAHGSIGKFINKFFAWGMHVQYNSFTNNKSVTTGSATLSVTTLLANIYLGSFNEKYKIHSYGYAGLGMAFLSLSGETENFTVQSNTRSIGIRAGGGAYFRISEKFAIYAETGLDYNFNTGTAKGYIPIKLGVVIFE